MTQPSEPVADPAEHRPALDPIGLLTSIGSPIALATALLFYFGWVRSQAQATAFGADVSVFAMSSQDFVLRSVNILFVPVLLLLLLAMLATRCDRLLRSGRFGAPSLSRTARFLRFSWLPLVALGVALAATAGTFGRVTLPLWFTLAVLGPVYGSVLSAAAAGRRRSTARLTVALLVALVTVLLFWQTERLAVLGGDALAQDLKDNLPDRLDQVELFTAKDLHLTGPGVRATPLAGSDSAYSWRYSGLFLLQRSGGKYFLLTSGWDTDTGRLVVLPDSDDSRLEFGG